MKTTTAFTIAASAALAAAEHVSVLHDATFEVEGPICDGTTGACPKQGDVAVADCVDTLNSYDEEANTCIAPEDATCVQYGDLLFKCEFTSTPSPSPAGPSPAPGPTDAPSPAGPSPAPGPTDAPSPAGPSPAPGPTDAPATPAPSSAPSAAFVGLTSLVVASIAYFL